LYFAILSESVPDRARAGDHDDRVVPLHSHKLTATLQHTLTGSPDSPQTNPLVSWYAPQLIPWPTDMAVQVTVGWFWPWPATLHHTLSGSPDSPQTSPLVRPHALQLIIWFRCMALSGAACMFLQLLHSLCGMHLAADLVVLM